MKGGGDYRNKRAGCKKSTRPDSEEPCLGLVKRGDVPAV